MSFLLGIMRKKLKNDAINSINKHFPFTPTAFRDPKSAASISYNTSTITISGKKYV